MVQFANINKKTKDLFKKQYDFKNEVKVTTNAGGFKLESGGYNDRAGLTGYTKANFTDANFGDVELEGHSDGTTKGQFKLKNAAKSGADVTVAGTLCGDLSLEAAYEKDMVATTLKLAHNLNKGSTAAILSAVMNSDGVSVGGAVDLDALTGSVADYNVGMEYSQKDLTASIFTTNQGNDITVSYFQKLSANMQLGGSMFVKSDSARLFTFGGEYNMDKDTVIKSKATSKGILGVAVTHTLRDQGVKVCVSSEHDTKGETMAAQKFGVSFAFGDL